MSSSKRNTTRMVKTVEFERQARGGRRRRKERRKQAKRIQAAIRYGDQ